MATTTLQTLLSDVARNLDAYDNTNVIGAGITQLELRSAINRCLRNLSYVTIAPLTLVTDGDMETSGVTNWTATSATASKLTSGANLVLYGTQSLRVLNSGANGRVQSATMFVVPSTSYLLQVRVRAVVGTANLIAYDVTNSADIESDTWANEGWGTISFGFTIPATCERLAIRLSGVGASDDTYWDNVILLRNNAREIPLPSWLAGLDQIRAFYTDINQDKFDRDSFSKLHEYDIRHDFTNPNQSYWLNIPSGIIYPLWIEATRPFSALTLKTDTTLCDRELVSLGGTVELLRVLVRRFPGDAGVAMRADYADYVKQFHIQQGQLKPPIRFNVQWRTGSGTPLPTFL